MLNSIQFLMESSTYKDPNLRPIFIWLHELWTSVDLMHRNDVELSIDGSRMMNLCGVS